MIEDRTDRNYFFLSTDFYSAQIRENIECRFKIKYSDAHGFIIEQMRITPASIAEKKLLQLRTNREIPGIVGVEGMYPRKNLWDNHLRGKFPR